MTNIVLTMSYFVKGITHVSAKKEHENLRCEYSYLSVNFTPIRRYVTSKSYMSPSGLFVPCIFTNLFVFI